MGNVSAHRTNVPPTSAYSYCPSSSRHEYEPIAIHFPIHSSHVRSLLQHSLNARSDYRHNIIGKHRVLGEHFASNLDRRSTQLLRTLMKLGMTVQAILHITSVSLSHTERLHKGIHAANEGRDAHHRLYHQLTELLTQTRVCSHRAPVGDQADPPDAYHLLLVRRVEEGV